MNYPRIFLIIGLSIVIVPFLGIPLVWKHIITVLLGASLMSLAILLRLALQGTRGATNKERTPKKKSMMPKINRPASSLQNSMIQESEPEQVVSERPEVIMEEEPTSHEQA